MILISLTIQYHIDANIPLYQPSVRHSLIAISLNCTVLRNRNRIMALRWGIVSAGFISHDFVNAVSTLPKEDHQVVAVAARSLSSAKEFADRHGIPRAYEGYETLAKDPEIGNH